MPKYTIGDAPPKYTIGDAPPPAPAEPQENAFQREVDDLTKIEPFNQRAGIGGHLLTAAGNIGGGVLSPLSLFAHPIQAGEMAVNSLAQGMSPAPNRIFQDVPSLQESLAQGVAENPAGMLENLAGGALGGELGGEALHGIQGLPELARGGEEGANVARLKALRVTPATKTGEAIQSDVERARPFLGQPQNLKDLRGQVRPALKTAIAPYRDVLAKIGDKVVRGPDGEPTTVKDLEAQRSQISAINRKLKNNPNNPFALQQAQQMGLNQAQLLAKETAIQKALYPHLEAAGVDPRAVLGDYGAIARTGQRLGGRITDTETAQPSGLGKMFQFELLPGGGLKIPNPLGAIRDIIAGRPWWSAKPTDLAVREGFRATPPMPDRSLPIQAEPEIRGLLSSAGGGPFAMPPVESEFEKPAPPPFDYGTRATRKGFMLPERAGGKIPLPYYPEMTEGERAASAMHNLRRPAPLALPAKASPLVTPPPESLTEILRKLARESQ